MPAPPRGRDHVTTTFLPAPGSVDVADWEGVVVSAERQILAVEERAG